MSALAAVNDRKSASRLKSANRLKADQINKNLAKAKELKNKNAQLFEELEKAAEREKLANKKATDLAAEKVSVEKKLQDAVKEAQEAAKKYAKLQKKNKQLNEQLNEQQTTLSKEKDVIRSELDNKVAAFKQLQTKLDSKGQEAVKADKREKQLRDKNNKLAEKIKESSSANDKCQTERKKLKGEVEDLKTDVRELQSIFDEIETDPELQHTPSLKF